jgi:hypothetical protein
VLGIIVDGDSYRSARSARDRNRTTEGVLRGQGWIIHHLWSLEWFKRPTEQLNRLVEAIEAARAGRSVAKDTRLASTVSEIHREVGSADPLSASVSGIESLPPRATRPTDPAPEGGSLADLLTRGLEVGAAVLVAEKGKGLEAAIEQLGKSAQPKEKK